MNIIVFYQNSTQSFLYNQLDLLDLFSLRIPIKTYKEKLQKSLFDLDSFTHIMFEVNGLSSFEDVLKNLKSKNHELNNVKLDKDDYIVFYDVNNYAIDTDQMSSIINKLPYSKGISACFINEKFKKKKSFTGIFGMNFEELTQLSSSKVSIEHLPEPDISIDISDMIARLDNPTEVLKLFSSSFQLRHFNSIQDDGHYFLKVSTNAKKLEEEYIFLKTVAPSVKSFYPQVGKGELIDGKFQYQIEKVYSFDASKLLINNVFEKEYILNNFLGKIREYIESLPRVQVIPDLYIKKIKKVLLDKNTSRVKLIHELEQGKILNNYCEQTLGKNLDEYCSDLNEKILNLIKKNKAYDFFLSHGDLCLPNILFNTETGQVKLIDPRGGEDYSQMPILYDLAKLSHSFLGLYDFIVSDLFNISLDNNLVPILDFELSSKMLHKLQHQYSQFLKELEVDFTLIRYIEASLFLSMIPLHQDHPKRMFAQLINSINIYKSQGEL